jgi:hypothetical protein
VTGQLPSFEDDDDRAYRAMVSGFKPTRAEVENAEHEVRKAVARGWVEIVRQDSQGRDVYRLTPAGQERARVILGLPPDTELA